MTSCQHLSWPEIRKVGHKEKANSNHESTKKGKSVYETLFFRVFPWLVLGLLVFH